MTLQSLKRKVAKYGLNAIVGLDTHSMLADTPRMEAKFIPNEVLVLERDTNV